MSEAAPTKIEPTLVIDPRLAFRPSGNRRFGVQRGGAFNTWRPVTTSDASNGQISWSNANPPSPDIALGRQVFAIVGFQVTLTGTNSSEDNFYVPNSGYSAPRYAPLGQVTNTITVNINGTSITQNNYQIINAQAHYLNNDASRSNSSMWPDMPDATWKYGLFNDSLLGTVGNPLGPYGNSTAHQITRGGFPVTVSANTSTSTTLTFYTCEPLFLSPFEINQEDNEGGLIGVQQFTLNINLQNLTRVWSWDTETAAIDGRVLTSVDVNVISNPTLMMNFITPSPTAIIPKSVSYSYKGITTYQSGPFSAGSIGGTFSATSNNIQFNSIADRLMIFLSQQNSDLNGLNGVTSADYFAAIDNISITWDNRSGVLAEVPAQGLYQIAQKNGYNKSWQAWNTYLGPVLILNMSEDVCLNSPAEAPSLQTTKQFQITVQCRDLNTDGIVINGNPAIPIRYTLNVVTIADGLFSVQNNSASVQNSILTPQDILDATAHSSKIEPRISAGDNFLGGSIADSLKKFAHKVNKALKDTKAVSMVANAAGYDNAAKFIKSQGYGLVGDGLVGGARLKKKHLHLMN